jgi:hypothetical protein
MIIFTSIKDERFLKEKVPKLIKTYALERFYKLKSTGIHNLMDEYLLKQFKTSIEKVLENLDEIIIIYKIGTLYTIELDSSVTNTHHISIYRLVQLIDFGNTDVKGLHIVDKTFNFIQVNLQMIYNLEMKGVSIEYGN